MVLPMLLRTDLEPEHQESNQASAIAMLLGALGYRGSGQAALCHNPQTTLLITNTRPVALELSRHRELEPDDTANHQDYRAIRKATGFNGRAVFTNGLHWQQFVPGDYEDYGVEDFSLEDPTGFWDLFMLSLTSAEIQ